LVSTTGPTSGFPNGEATLALQYGTFNSDEATFQSLIGLALPIQTMTTSGIS
jgi:hypothetical protein